MTPTQLRALRQLQAQIVSDALMSEREQEKRKVWLLPTLRQSPTQESLNWVGGYLGMNNSPPYATISPLPQSYHHCCLPS